MLLAGLVVFVMIAEAAIFYVLGIGDHSSAQPGTSKDVQTNEAADGDVHEDSIEVEVDSFNVTNTRSAADAIVHVSFKLVAVVAKGQEVEFDQAANKTHKARVRQAVIEVARSATMEDLADPNLTTFKRLIQEKINKSLRRSYVVEVIVSEFRTIEQ